MKQLMEKKNFRKDYKTKCLSKIINDLDLNISILQVLYDVIKKLKEILNNKDKISVNDIEKYINYIIEEDEEKIF